GAEALDGHRDGALGLVERADVGRRRQDFGERLARLDVVDRALQLHFVARDEGQLRALLGDLAREDEAEAARPAGDEDRLAGKLVRVAAPPHLCREENAGAYG